nr:uncharacterized protein LOC124812659 [Hydra vulgaris]
MPRKCSVGNCRRNYDSANEHVKVYKFPSDKELCERWLAALPNKIQSPTDNMGVCEKHWPLGCSMHYPKRSKYQIPSDPPSLFPGCFPSMLRQTGKTFPQTNFEKISIKSRNSFCDELDSFNKIDKIKNFEVKQFLTDVKQRFPDYFVVTNALDLTVFNMTFSRPPETNISVTINTHTQQLHAYIKHTQIHCNDILGFSHKLTRWSQLEAIISRMKSSKPQLSEELKHLLQEIKCTYGEKSDEINFLIEQLQLQMMPVRGKRYSTLVVRRALELYLSSRCCYRILCDTLSLPHPRILKLKLGRIGEVGTQKECEECIKTVFETLTIAEKRCCLLFDEMYVKPSIRFRGCHLIGYSEDNPAEISKTILCFMIKPMFGKPAFVCRMAPVYKLSGIFVQNLIVEITQTVAKLGGEILCLISDNLPTNRSIYQFFALSLNEPWLGNICNQSIIMLHDPVHLFKSIRNNWLT